MKPEDELLIWYGDSFALDRGVPVLTPANIKGIDDDNFLVTRRQNIFRNIHTKYTVFYRDTLQ